jgi:hypothetical protein
MAVAAPFYNAIKGTTAGTPGTGAFTPNAAASGFRAWSTVPTGWIGLVRYEDGSTWELSYSYWNGTTLSRGTNQRVDSSSGSLLSLTSAATGAMVIDASEIMSHLGSTQWAYSMPVPGSTNFANVRLGASPTVTGTAGSATVATTNFLTEQVRGTATSATTANAQAAFTWSGNSAVAVSSTTAGHGGWEFTCRFGCATTLPTGPRLFIGMTGTTFVGNTGEPSALTAHYAVFAKDSTDTNIQLLVNSNAGTGTKTDTGIPLVANGWYEACIWQEPGGSKVYALLIRLDTGDIFYTTTTTDVPANTTLFPQVLAGLSSTTGTAIALHIGSLVLRMGT